MTDIPAVEPLLQTMADNLTSYLQQRGITQPAMVGIHSGGVWLAERLHAMLDLETPLGTLDISFYRDDFTRKGLNPKVQPSDLPFEAEDRHIILVDDVVMSGRTIRAALNELFDFGRPASVILAALIDLDQRQLPIRPDVVGQTIQLPAHQRIKLRGPEPLRLELVNT